MTLADGLEMVRQHLAYDLDAYTDEVTDAKILPAWNWSLRGVAQRARLTDASIPVTLVAGQGTYDLRKMPSDGRGILKPTRVIVGGRPLSTASGDFGVWALAELERRDPMWRTAAAGTTTKAAFHGNHLYLHPAPDAATVAKGSHFVAGTYIPAPMTLSNLAAELPLPIEAHEAVCYLAALRLATPTATESSQMARLQAFAAGWVDALDELANANANTATPWGTTSPLDGDVWMGL